MKPVIAVRFDALWRGPSFKFDFFDWLAYARPHFKIVLYSSSFVVDSIARSRFKKVIDAFPAWAGKTTIAQADLAAAALDEIETQKSKPDRAFLAIVREALPKEGEIAILPSENWMQPFLFELHKQL